MQGLDRYITGNYGEDSVAPEFVKARELSDFELREKVVIDAAPQPETPWSVEVKSVPVTVKEVRITSGMVYVTTEELAWPLVIPEDATVWFADNDE